MALEKLTIPIIVDGGINTKSDPMLVDGRQALVQQNTNFDELGAINKRSGGAQLTDGIDSAGVYPGINALSDLPPKTLYTLDSELLICGKLGTESLHGFNEAEDIWELKVGEHVPVFSFVEDIYGETAPVDSPWLLQLPTLNWQIIAYSSNGTGKVFVQDYVTGTKKLIWSKACNYVQVRVKIGNSVASTKIYVIYDQTKNDNERNLFVDKMAAGAWVASQVGTWTMEATSVFDTLLIGEQLYLFFLAYRAGDVAPYWARFADGTFAEVNSFHGETPETVVFSYRHMSCASIFYLDADPSNNYYRVYSAYCNNNRLRVYSFILIPADSDSLTYEKDVLLANTTYMGRVTLADISTEAAKNLIIAYSILRVTQDVAYYSDTTTIGYLEPEALTISSGLTDNFALASRPYVYNGAIYFIAHVLHRSSSRYAIIKHYVDSIGAKIRTVGSLAIFDAAYDKFDKFNPPVYNDRNRMLPELCLKSTDELYYPSLVNVRSMQAYDSSVPGNSSAIYVRSLKIYRIEFDSEYQGINAILGANLYIAGSKTLEYDGNGAYDQNFLDAPDIWVELFADTGAAIPAGDYYYVAVYEFIDSNGQLHVSRLSNERKITLTDVSKVKVHYFNATNCPHQEKNFSVAIYRTEKNKDLFYRLGVESSTQYMAGMTTNPYVDNIIDAQLICNQQLYTNFGELQNIPLPPVKYLLTANSRIFAISSEDENLIYISKKHTNGYPAQFSTGLTLRTDAGLLNHTGKAKVLAGMDGKIIVLKDNVIAYFFGDGPNDQGMQNDYSDPKILISDIGCADVRSVVTIPDGVMFKSNKGIYLLDRSFSYAYIGAEVEQYNSEEIVAAVAIPGKHKVLFYTANRTMMYDYLVKKWATWDWHGADMNIWSNMPTFIYNDLVYVEADNIYKDQASYYPLRFVSPWIKLKGNQDYFRLYRIMISGKWYSSHQLIVKVYFDYNDAPAVQTFTINPDEADAPFQYRLKMDVQKCESFKIEIYDTNQSGSGRSYKLNNISVLIGAKAGLYKISDSKKY